MDDHLQQPADQHVCSHNDRRIGSANYRTLRRTRPCEGRSPFAVGESRFIFDRPSRRYLQGAASSTYPCLTVMLGLWRQFTLLRLFATPVVSIAKISAAARRGIGQFVLACDTALRQPAKRRIRQPRDRRRTGPGRRDAGMVPHVWSAARGRLRSCSAATISMLISPSAMAG